MAPHLSFKDGAILKVPTEGIAYGISVVLSINALDLLLLRAKTGKLNKVMFYGALALLALSTMHIVTDIQYLRQGFVQYPQGPDVYFGLITTPVKVAEQSSRITAVSLADALTVWRLWGVWDWNKRVIIFPTITLVATIVCAIAFVADQNLIKQEPGVSIFTPSVLDWTVAFLACSLVTTWYCTGFISYRLMYADRRWAEISATPYGRSKWKYLLRVLIESAALYSGTNLVYMVTYASQTNGEALLSGWEVPVASITFSLIIIRVNKIMNPVLPTASSGSGNMNSGGRRDGPNQRPLILVPKHSPADSITKASSTYELTPLTPGATQ